MGLSKAVLLDRMKGSLFFVPALCVAGAIALAVIMITIDNQLAPDAGNLPYFLASTVDSARSILSTVAAATITVAGIAFSIALLVFQMASSQYSPRVVHGLFRDPVNKRVMGIVVGTFTYCLVVLQSVRGALSDDGEAVIPNMSVLMALVLGLVAVLAIVAFINHNAHAMEVSELLQDVTDLTLAAISSHWSTPEDAPPPLPDPAPQGDGYIVNFAANGWVQDIDRERLLDLVDPGGTIRVEVTTGRYAVSGVALATIWPTPTEPELVVDQVQSAIHLGRTRTLAQDPEYGIRQLADVAIRALSTGIDDPTTAQDAIFHIAAVLRAAQQRVPSPAVVVEDDRCLFIPDSSDQSDLVTLAFDELRRSASKHPAVCIYLLEAISMLCRSTEPPPPHDAQVAMREQARLIVEGASHADLIPEDLLTVRQAYESRFGDG